MAAKRSVAILLSCVLLYFLVAPTEAAECLQGEQGNCGVSNSCAVDGKKYCCVIGYDVHVISTDGVLTSCTCSRRGGITNGFRCVVRGGVTSVAASTWVTFGATSLAAAWLIWLRQD